MSQRRIPAKLRLVCGGGGWVVVIVCQPTAWLLDARIGSYSALTAPCVWWRRVGVGYCVPAAAAWLLDAHIGSYSALTAHKHSCRYRR